MRSPRTRKVLSRAWATIVGVTLVIALVEGVVTLGVILLPVAVLAVPPVLVAIMLIGVSRFFEVRAEKWAGTRSWRD